VAGQPFVDSEKVAVMGFSMGASAIHNELIPRQFRKKGGLNFKAAISFYAYCSTGREGLFPLMEIVAEKDERLATACIRDAKSAGIELRVIPGAYHAFDQPGATGEDLYRNRLRYDADATAKAKELTKAFLKKHFDG